MKEELQPPKWAYNLLRQFCDPYLWEGISGDLYEVFLDNVESKGSRKAKWIYVFQSFGFLRGKFKKKDKRRSNMKSIWYNYFLTSFRSIKKQKVLFGINIIGLVMAITCSLFALIFINDELHFDEQHSDGEKIYRLYKRYINVSENIDHNTFETSGMMGPTIQEEYPEVESYTRVLPWWHSIVLTFDKKNIISEHTYFADSTFFDFFDFEVLRGDPSTFLTAPSSIVLTESLAKKIFGDANPIGEQIIGFNYLNYTVTGIVADAPRQSSFQFEALISWSTTVPDVGPLSMSWMNNWLAQAIYTFVKLQDDTSPEALVQKLPDMMNRHFEERSDVYFLKLLPLKKMYLQGEKIRGTERMKSGSITFVYTLGFSAFLIFLIASVNYVNISLSTATQTRTEVGIRKVMGSSRKQLMGRFISETFFSTILASIVSVLLLIWIMPSANELSGKTLPLSSILQPSSILALLGFVIFISFLVGIYPSMILSSPPISTILKSSGGMVRSTGWFRKVLLTLQYSISIFLIICTMVVIRQTNYLKNKPVGFDQDQVLVLDIGNEVGNSAEVLETEMLKHPNILNVSISRSTIGDGSYTTTVVPEGYTDELETRIFGVDQEFFEVYGLETLHGRTFLKGSVADSNNLVVNQRMVDFMGWKNPIGKHIRFDAESEPAPIIGVVNDFHIHSLATSEIEPMILQLNTTTKWFAAAKIGNGNIPETVQYLNEIWDKLARRTPFDYFFTNEWFDQQYKKERQLLKLSSTYAIISIILCGLGLYGLTALLLQQRTKEISIRKVLGATLTSIVSMINRQFLIIIGISFMVAAPLAYYLVSDWLDAFAHKTEIDFSPFAVAGGFTLLLSILIVSVLSVKTANTNPSKNLNSE